MSGIWINERFFNLSCGIGRLLAFGLALCALSVAVTAMPIRPVTTQDQKQVAAQNKYNEAKALRKKGTDESLHLALEKYEEALKLWKEVNDAAHIGKTLNQMAKVCIALNENEKGLEYFKQTLPYYEAAGEFFEAGVTYFMLGEEEKGLNLLLSAFYDELDNKEKAMELRKKADETPTPSQRP